MQFKKVIRRWMFNGLGVVLVLLVILEVAMAIVIRSYYYQQVQNSLYTRVKSLSDMLSTYVERPEFNFEDDTRTYIEEFRDKETIELQILNASGKIIGSSTGFLPEEELFPDFRSALERNLTEGAEPKGIWQGRSSIGQKICAVTMLVFKEDGTLCGAVRCVAALDNVDAQITLLISVIALFGLAVLFFVMLSSSYFVSSILRPLMEIGDTAKRIAQGDYTCRIEKQFDDEIGELCETINHMAAEIEAADRMQSEFIASVSHELRTPLTAIKGWSETLRSDPTDQDMLQKGLEVISGETERLSGMVEELLDFARVQSTVKVSEKEKMDVFAEVEEVALLFRERAIREGLTLQCVLQEELPPVLGDRARLRQVFANVLDNAIKYSEDEGIIRVEAASISEGVQVVISDNGIGINPQDLPNVKNKFFRANARKSGSGIGLAVADEIVQAHGGMLEIESTPGKGTVVTITLPVCEK